MNTITTFTFRTTNTLIYPRFFTTLIKRFQCTTSEEITRQNTLFDTEQKKQREKIGRVEKIEVEYEGPTDKALLVMNKNISTPYDCARHISEKVSDQSVVALLNGDALWHMHKPLPDSCKLQFLHYRVPQPAQVNKIFWRTCSFILGAVACNAFKDKVGALLHSFPSPNVRSGSFVYDVQLGLEDWKPTEKELKVLSIEAIKLSQQAYPIHCLDVSESFSLELFKNNPHKYGQVPNIAANNNGKVTLFRAGQHIDISRGPMVPNTNHMGRFTVANVIKLKSGVQGNPIYRFQGVALPKSIILNHFAFGVLEERARKLNPARIPGSQETFEDDNTFVAQVTA